MRKKISTEDFNFIYNLVPRFCVDLLIKTDEGVLLSKRDIPPAIGKWHFPGGTLYKGEKITEAAERIAKEELGIEINIVKDLGVLEYFGEEALMGHDIAILIQAEIKSGKLRGSWQAEEVKFFKTLPENIICRVKEFLLSSEFI